MNFVKKQKILGTNSRHDSHENPENKEVNCLALFIRLISLQLKQLIIYKKNFANKELWSWFIVTIDGFISSRDDKKPKTKRPKLAFTACFGLLFEKRRDSLASFFPQPQQFWSIYHLIFGHP
mgnify:CR=1 FL=1